jgi:hypothetical protein
MVDLEIQRLLVDSGFQLVKAPVSARWVAAGRLENGTSTRVTCAMGSRGGWVLLVPSESERKQLTTQLSRCGFGTVDVRAERMEPRLPWLAVGVGVGALTLFSWVVTNIPTLMP